ncbi:MAG TPA: helix-turn-helix domain-containing protein, partial [Thermomicrobiales bacterium]|nr:helix-turn-helix domain-containing protein [Thermomicrobiales bacterium]
MALNRPIEPQTTADDTFLSLAQAADYLGLSQAALEAALGRGELRAAGNRGHAQFDTHELDSFLDNQRARAVITGKLTMSLPMQIDVPRLLRAMVTLPDEQHAAEALANEITALAGTCCKVTAVLRLDEATESVRLLALSDFPGRQRMMASAATSGERSEADLLDLPEGLRQAVVEHGGHHETLDIQPLLRPLMRAQARELI